MSLIQSFRDYLSRRYSDIQVTIEPDSGISFSYNGLSFRLNYYSSEPNYYRLMLPRVSILQDISLDSLCKLACEISASYKVGKFELINNEIWICYEQLVDPNANNDSVFDFSIRVLSTMISVFRERMQGLVIQNQH